MQTWRVFAETYIFNLVVLFTRFLPPPYVYVCMYSILVEWNWYINCCIDIGKSLVL